MSTTQAQKIICDCVKKKRLQHGYTQAALAKRAGVKLPTLRLFEQTGKISLESLLKILLVLDELKHLVDSLKSREPDFQSIEDVIKATQLQQKQRKRGWRK